MNITKNKTFDCLISLIVLALFVAIEVVLSRFISIKAWDFKLSFSFVPIVMVAILYGPVASGMVSAISDFVGALLFPFGPFFPGYTITAFLTGLLYGIFLRKKQSMLNIILAVLSVQLIGSLLMNTFWISLTSGSPMIALLPTRILQTVFMFVAQVILIPMISKSIIPVIRKVELK